MASLWKLVGISKNSLVGSSKSTKGWCTRLAHEGNVVIKKFHGHILASRSEFHSEHVYNELGTSDLEIDSAPTNSFGNDSSEIGWLRSGYKSYHVSKNRARRLDANFSLNKLNMSWKLIWSLRTSSVGTKWWTVKDSSYSRSNLSTNACDGDC